MPSVSTNWLLGIAPVQLPDAPDLPSTPQSFTDDEISQAVAKLVRSSIRRDYGILGERKTLDTFNDTVDAATGVFVLTPGAPFYVALLGAGRLSSAAEEAVSSATSLMSSIANVGRRAQPLDNITSLGNARVALSALEAASGNRSNIFDDITASPAFQRFDRHAARFLSDSANRIRQKGEIVQTPQQARKLLGPLASDLVSKFQDVQRRVRLLHDAIENYNSLKLPSLFATQVISKARSVLDDRFRQLESLTPLQRLEVLRETTLDVLTSKSVVRGFGSLPKSGEFVPVEGIAHLFADADHPATRAVLESDLLDPYVILDGADSLVFTLDGTTSTVIASIPHSFLAHLDGFIREPFEIDAGVNDEINIEVSSAPDVTATLTAGTRTAAQVVADINSAVGSSPVIADTYLSPEKFIGAVDAINATGSTVEFVKTGDDWSFFNVVVGDGVIVQAGDMVQVYLLVTGRSGLTITCAVSGPGTTVDVSDVLISVGSPGRFVRVRIADGEEITSLDVSRSLRVGEADFPAATTIGMTVGVELTCRRTRADEVATAINSSASSSISGIPRISAEALFVGGDPLPGRTDVGNPTTVVSSSLKTTGDVIDGGPAPAKFAVAGAAGAGVQVGDVITMRTAAAPNQVGAWGIITLVSDTEIRANMSDVTPSIGTGFSLEFGVNLGLQKDAVIRILEPSPIAGDYRVGLNESDNPTESTIDRPLPFFIGLGGQPFTFQMQIGAFGVSFYSEDRTVNSQLEVDGTAASQFFSSFPRVSVGGTKWVSLGNDPKVLGFGDIIEFHSGQYDESQESRTIIGFENGQTLLELDRALSNSILEFDFAEAIDTPFARIRKVYRNNYDLLKAQLTLWLELSVNDEQYISNLNRFLNPLIVNENPTLAAVNTAKVHVQSLVQALQQLQLVLTSYEVDVVPQVDTLIDSFLQRGADKAVDTLLECRFSDFFTFSSEEVSYIGDTLERLRDVSRLDLPVRKTQRKELLDQELILSEHEDPDFEFDQSDIQDTGEPDLPGSFIEISGGNF